MMKFRIQITSFFLVILVILLAGCVVASPAEESTAADATVTEFRTVAHALGETEVSADPQRVVVLDAMDNVLALGIKPVGAANWMGATTGEQATFPAYLDAAALEGIEWLGDNKTPSLETITSLQPDLILGRTNQHEEIYEELSAIAPTVLINPRGVDGWKRQLLTYADALNRVAEAETLLADYDARTAAISEQLAQMDPVPSVSLVRFDLDRITIYNKEIFAGNVLDDAGITRPAYEDKEQRTERISLEQVELIEGDVLITTAANPDTSVLAQLRENPLWSQLSAVQNEQVYAAPFDVWIGGWTITGANLILDELTDIFDLEISVETTGDDTTDGAMADALFPVTIEHKFGSSTIGAEPVNVVSLGYSEQDAILALGVVPVAIRDWFGDQPFGVWPWSQEALGDAEPVLMNMPWGELNFELIASLNPDLIVATHSGITEDEYETLSEIAPVLAQSGDVDDFGMAWQDQTMSIGMALGKTAEAEALVAGVEAKIAAAATPAFEGKTIAWITPAEGGEFWAVGEHTPPFQFFASLGLGGSPDVKENIGELSSLRISSERLDFVDTSVLIIRTPSEEALAELMENAVLQQLDVVANDRIIYFIGNDPNYGAISFSTVASLPFVVDELVPEIVEKIGQ
ncbi:MAG: ABC transporter substrate-binding protein [Chloroflexota bacterium]